PRICRRVRRGVARLAYIARRLARAGRGLLAALDPFRHLLQVGHIRAEIEGALVGIPGELLDGDRDAMTANPEHTAGADDEPVDLLAAGIHQRGGDMADLAVVIAIDACPFDFRDILLVSGLMAFSLCIGAVVAA